MEGIVTPGQFLILKFDFSSVYRGPNMDLAAQSLREYMELVFEEFYNKYATYLDGNHSHRITRSNPGNSMGDCVALVNRVLSNAKRSTGKPLADIRGVSNTATPIKTSTSTIANLDRSIYLWMNMTHSAITFLHPTTLSGRVLT